MFKKLRAENCVFISRNHFQNVFKGLNELIYYFTLDTLLQLKIQLFLVW